MQLISACWWGSSGIILTLLVGCTPIEPAIRILTEPQSLFASAIVINENGDAVTVRHFTQRCEKFVAISMDGAVHSSYLAIEDLSRDLSLIHINGLNALPVFTTLARRDQSVGFWSFKISNGHLPLMPTWKSGQLETPPDLIDSHKYFHFTGDVRIGDSGAGLIDLDNQLLGMVLADLKPDPYGGIVLKASEIELFLFEQNITLPATVASIALSCVHED